MLFAFDGDIGTMGGGRESWSLVERKAKKIRMRRRRRAGATSAQVKIQVKGQTMRRKYLQSHLVSTKNKYLLQQGADSPVHIQRHKYISRSTEEPLVRPNAAILDRIRRRYPLIICCEIYLRRERQWSRTATDMPRHSPIAMSRRLKRVPAYRLGSLQNRATVSSLTPTPGIRILRVSAVGK